MAQHRLLYLTCPVKLMSARPRIRRPRGIQSGITGAGTSAAAAAGGATCAGSGAAIILAIQGMLEFKEIVIIIY